MWCHNCRSIWGHWWPSVIWWFDVMMSYLFLDHQWFDVFSSHLYLFGWSHQCHISHTVTVTCQLSCEHQLSQPAQLIHTIYSWASEIPAWAQLQLSWKNYSWAGLKQTSSSAVTAEVFQPSWTMVSPAEVVLSAQLKSAQLASRTSAQLSCRPSCWALSQAAGASWAWLRADSAGWPRWPWGVLSSFKHLNCFHSKCRTSNINLSSLI